MIIEKRSIPMAIILTIITCGIYGLFWDYKIWDSLYRATNKPSTAGIDVLLSLVTCGIYYIYMMYKMGKMESEAYRMYDMGTKDDSILYLIISIFGLSIIAMAIMQSSLNNIADVVNDAHRDPQQRPY